MKTILTNHQNRVLQEIINGGYLELRPIKNEQKYILVYGITEDEELIKDRTVNILIEKGLITAVPMDDTQLYPRFN